MLMLCPAYKIELAIPDAFKESALNNTYSQNYANIFCFDKRIHNGNLSRGKLFLRVLSTCVLNAQSVPDELNTKEML